MKNRTFYMVLVMTIGFFAWVAINGFDEGKTFRAKNLATNQIVEVHLCLCHHTGEQLKPGLRDNGFYAETKHGDEYILLKEVTEG